MEDLRSSLVSELVSSLGIVLRDIPTVQGDVKLCADLARRSFGTTQKIDEQPFSSAFVAFSHVAKNAHSSPPDLVSTTEVSSNLPFPDEIVDKASELSGGFPRLDFFESFEMSHTPSNACPAISAKVLPGEQTK